MKFPGIFFICLVNILRRNSKGVTYMRYKVKFNWCKQRLDKDSFLVQGYMKF